MKNVYSVLLGILVLSVMSCSNEEPRTMQDSKSSALSQREVFRLYDAYANSAIESFNAEVNSFNPVMSRSSSDTLTAYSLGTLLGEMSMEEIDSLTEIIRAKYPDANDTISVELALDSFIDTTSPEEGALYMEFVAQYPEKVDKMSYLSSVVANKSGKIQKTYIATAATLDKIATPIANGLVSAKTVHSGGTGYVGDCEKKLLADLSAMCAGDVMVEFWGGGPEDIAADVTCTAGDVADVIVAVHSYYDCKHGR